MYSVQDQVIKYLINQQLCNLKSVEVQLEVKKYYAVYISQQKFSIEKLDPNTWCFRLFPNNNKKDCLSISCPPDAVYYYAKTLRIIETNTKEKQKRKDLITYVDKPSTKDTGSKKRGLKQTRKPRDKREEVCW